MRAYYSQSICNFLSENINSILGKLASQHHFDVSQNQNKAWQEQIQLLTDNLSTLDEGEIIFEYEIPRIGKRIDNVILYKGIIFLLEFKTGISKIQAPDLNQVMDYALDLKNFHKESHNAIIVPILIAVGESQKQLLDFNMYQDGIYQPFSCHINQLLECFQRISELHTKIEILDSSVWINSVYSPTPTIIEAARALYQGHGVSNISRSDAGAINLTLTANDVGKIIDECKQEKKKAICFITGVPGAGKTLAGLNIVNDRQNYKEEELATFLSGNGPLVSVLREALARDKVLVSGDSKKDAEREVNSFIQNIHHFRDDALKTSEAPAEHVVLFDEAQRAWDKNAASKFMSQKRGITDFEQSEPEFLISIMDRHQDWAVIVCLVGNGQEINTGEAGLVEWFRALKNFPEWEIYAPKLLPEITQTEKVIIREHLHLYVSLRSFRSECLADFISAVLDNEIDVAKSIYLKLSKQYPIAMTRDLNRARQWLREKTRGTELAGIVASSGARRLKKEGIYVQRDFNVEAWFLNDQEDVRSANFLEEVATEFDCQGLELDWTCVAWDLDLRRVDNQWEYKNFVGTKWNSINKYDARNFKKNAYRVLLTRARQGMILYIPIGDDLDITRLTKEYDLIYSYLSEIGIVEV